MIVIAITGVIVAMIGIIIVICWRGRYYHTYSRNIFKRVPRANDIISDPLERNEGGFKDTS